MIDINPNHLETVRRILAEHVPECEVRAFGSRVTWTAKDYSDLDLAVVGPHALDADALRRLKEALEESDLPFRVDVIDWHAISDSFRKVIEKKYEVVQKGDRKRSGMAGEWRESSIRDVSVGVFDGPHATPKKTTTGPVFLGISSLGSGRIDLTLSEHLSEEDFIRWTRRVTPQSGDVVFSYETRLGEAAMIPDGLRCCLGRRMALVRPDHSKLVPRFFLYYFLGPDFQDFIRSRTVRGSTVDRIPLIEFPDFPVRLPPLPEQRAIAHVLGTLDGKIESNRRMNETLEQIARAIFKSWFVDFDPVRLNQSRAREQAGTVSRTDRRPRTPTDDAVKAKAEGGRRKAKGAGGDIHPSSFTLDPSVAALFPDSLTDSPLGAIPKGWTTGRLGDVAENHRRGVRPDELEPATPYIALEHMPRCHIALTDWGTVDGVASGKFRFRRGEILFGKLRPYFHKVGAAPVDGVCSTDILVIAPKSGTWFGFVLGHVSSDEFVAFTNAASTGTRMPRTNWSDMARFEVVLPPEPVADGYDRQVRGLTEMIVANVHESRTLAAIRDALLPKLLSGEIRVSQAERLIEDVT